MNRDSGVSGGERWASAADDRAMRELAARLKADGEARLRLDAASRRRLAGALAEARRCGRAEACADETVRRLCRDGRRAEACAEQALSEGGLRLPACGGRPRVLVLMEALCAGGDEALTGERLLAALQTFDAARPMTMAELWAAPEAARIALTEAFAQTAASVAARARRCAEAEAWLNRAPRRLARAEDAFVEHALRRAGEEGLAEVRPALARQLARRGRTIAEAIRRVHEARALDQLRLENLLAGMRALDALDWQAGFRAISRVDRELRRDPDGTYPAMDAPSRAAVRASTAAMAKRLRLPELAVASHAVEAARGASGARGTVCWWLYDDAGRRALAGRLGLGARLRRRVPDPSGNRTVAALIALAAALLLPAARVVRSPWLWPACAPLAWAAANALANRVYPKFVRPAPLLKLEMARVPDDCRTLVTIPALLSCPERVDEVCDRLEALGCLESDGNIAFLLLGDFADAPRADMPGDADVLARARERIAAMNARAGRPKYAYLHRPRTLLPADGVWMGRDRKRGALAALNRLLLGEDGAADAFSAEGAACGRLAGRYAFVLTLDADTRLLPGAARRLIGALAHPLNRPDGERGAAVLQPRMETLPSDGVNAFVRLFAGAGGVDVYPASASNLWQDLTGRGIYAGKGIYDVVAFHARLGGALPEGRILSHDLVEGAIAGAAFVGDEALYDATPTSLPAALRRLHRWTRGDWQLLPVLLRRGALPNGRRLSAADRARMADNLLRSLRDPATLILLLAAAWTGNGGALLAALAAHYLEALLNPFGGDALSWRRATARLAALPAFAACSLDAAARALWRMGVSGRRLMDWVTAADAEGHRGADGMRVPCRAAAILALPGLLVRGWTLAALALAGLFFLAPGWMRDLAAERVGERAPLSDARRAVLTAVARDTWRFFEACVPSGTALPPDNVQIDPPVGAARRTSPTNIALYMMSALAACRLGFIDADAARSRIGATLDALERMPKWRGHPFNWHDIDDLSALSPRYVSSVDSGNLAAALMLCASAAEAAGDAALAARLCAFAKNMDFAALYDADRELFYIGMDVDGGQPSGAHYDLLASESRILSFTAMLLGKIPARHWRRLGRGCAAVDGGAALLSWSGTMFEYLMPELFMPAPEGSLLGDSARAAVRAQRRQGRRTGRPWGVSESGYCAFDAALNYQYRAFGLRALALGGEAGEDVVAPYASALAAMIDAQAAADNLARMRTLGWAGEWGLYEAADYQRTNADGAPALVRSHMAHHQGMILCALCNALTGDSLRRDFMRQAEARALAPLLEERACPAPRRRRAVPPAPRTAPAPLMRASWAARPRARLAETLLLYGGGATALVTADGAAHYARFGVCATRFDGDLIDRHDAACTHLTDLETGRDIVLGGAAGAVTFAPGGMRVEAKLNRIEARLEVGVSPEDGALVRAIELRNAGDRPVRCAVTDVAPVALATDADWRAHAIFKSLFVESSRPAGDALLFRVRPRGGAERCPVLAHMIRADGEITCESDYMRWVGRTGDTGRAGGLPGAMSGTVGAVLNPVSALRAEIELPAKGRAQLHFALALLGESESATAWLERYRQPSAATRAIRLAGARAEAMLGFLGLDANRHRLLQRLAALLVDGRLAAEAKALPIAPEAPARDALWGMGLSGEKPLIAVFIRDAAQSDCAAAAIRAQAFYRAAGLEVELALVDDGAADYARPIRERLAALLAAAGLCPGEKGVRLLDGGQMTPEQRTALMRAAAVPLSGRHGFEAQACALLSTLDVPARGPARELATGASTLRPQARGDDNGWGGFLADGSYAVDVRADAPTPAPWCDILADDHGGLLLTERGGGFFWRGNSRFGRLTPYGNDARREGWGLMLYLIDEARGAFLRLLPGEAPQMPFRATFDAVSARYAFETRRLSGETSFCLRGDRPEVCIDVRLENRALRGERFRLAAFVDWRMGGDAADAAWLATAGADGACLASGVGGGVGYLASTSAFAQTGAPRSAFLGRGGVMAPEGIGESARCGGWTLEVPLRIRRGATARARLALGWAPDEASALARARALRGDRADVCAAARAEWRARMEALMIETPDERLNRLVNGFLVHQVRAARVLGRTGLYQPGGAYGFRDQLQDMLALMHYEPERARAHLLRCAARQFEAGDVLHWWHPPYTGVRTRISDDLLFLPYVAAAYVRLTGDAAVLDALVPFLADMPIPEGGEDLYAEMKPGDASGTLHAHCMRAFQRASATGAHGLALMGAGDWNDGMNRVGAKGRGESVWLSEFLAACADDYADVAPDPADAARLRALAQRMRAAVEQHGWDGGWYLRAYADDGAALGGDGCAECRIDAVSQAWAVLAGLDGARCRSAMDAAWRLLADEAHGLIRLLDPPFEGKGIDPGYIRGYPAGVRENGAQYTHGALWLLLALIRQGDAARAHRALEMLLPCNHADAPDKARVYRVEPYVTAADVLAREPNAGRGGWTWYTGSAAWLHVCVLALLGYERRGDAVRLDALLGDWPGAAVTVRFGGSRYRLVCDREARAITLDGAPVEGPYVRMVDDKQAHEARFPARRGR